MRKPGIKILYRTRQQVTIGEKSYSLGFIVWAWIERENSRNAYTERVGITCIGQGDKGLGVTFNKFKLPKRQGRIDSNAMVQELFGNKMHGDAVTEAIRNWYLNHFNGTPSNGEILWFDKMRGEGFVRDSLTGNMVTIYACNVLGANSSFPELVTNVDFNKGDKIKFSLFSFGPLQGLSATKVERVNQ